jgi:hypothetical protein
MKCFFAFIVVALAGSLPLPALAQDIPVGPLVEISRPSAVGSCDDGFDLFGSWSVNNAVEPSIAVNPVHPNNIVAAWIQGPAQDIVSAVTLDGGQNWQRVPLPLTLCSGGTWLAAADPWISFAPNGDLYAVVLFGNPPLVDVGVSKSTDGGLHWLAPVVLANGADHPSITADPTNARFVYAIWDASPSKHSGAAVFSRTADGGVTWETPRALVQTEPQSYIQFSQILVLPNGMLIDMYEFDEEPPNKSCTFTNLQLKRSSNQGQTWSAPINAVTMTPLYTPNCDTVVVDPKTGQQVADPTNPSFAVDGRNGNLYAVWEDGRFSNFQYNDIAFSMSADGGLTWSAPIRVNQTPLNIPTLNRQSFLPVIAASGNGTVGVTYYDFRFNNSSPGLPTDYWLAQCQPSSTVAASDPACWGSEVRLTNSSFNIELVPIRINTGANGFILGDYFGLAPAGSGFVSTFAAVDSQNDTSVFARRVGP